MKTARQRAAPATSAIQKHTYGHGVVALAHSSQSTVDQIAERLAASHLFWLLREAGVVRAVPVRGHIPGSAYRQFLECWVPSFVARERLSERGDWQEFVEAARAGCQTETYAMAWGVSSWLLRRVARFVRPQHDAPSEIWSKTPGDMAGATPDGTSADVEQLAVEFVRRYDIARHEFVELVLSGRYTSNELANRVGCPVDEAAALLAAVESLQITDAAAGSATAAPSATLPVRSRHCGRVEFGSDDRLLFTSAPRPPGDGWLAFSEAEVERFLMPHASPQERRLLVLSLRVVNERALLESELARTVCECQYSFLLSGDRADLRPLRQADVARDLCVNRSAVSRLARRLIVATPLGDVTLCELMASRRQVVAALAAGHPEWTDQAIADFMAARHGTRLSRRAVSSLRSPLRPRRSQYAASRPQ